MTNIRRALGARTLRATIVAGAIVAGGVLAAGSAAHAAGSGTPYTDPSAVGYIGLCNKAGQQITSGSITTTPFAWRAVSSVPAKAPYDESGRTATLYAFQPRQGIPPGEWSGEQLTSSSRYTNAAHPMVAATSGDDSLEDFIQDFHPAWNGLLQVRMYLGAPDHPIYSLTYPALDIQVTGNTWHEVDGGTVSCTSGKSVSLETIVLPTATPHPHKSGDGTGKSSTGPTASASSKASTVPGAAGGGSANPLAARPATASSHTTSIVVGVLIAAFVVLVAAGYLVSRRRRPPAPSSGSLVHHTAEKGR